MDVRCEQCRAQYALEDERITEAGLTVRCSSCGYTFRVKRKALFVTVPVGPDESSETASTPKRPQAPEKREWRVRQSKGEVFFTCRELTTLQKWIVERKVGRNHEISLAGSGDTWKRLGDIPELASFFHVVDAAERVQSSAVTAAPAAGAVFPTLTPLTAPAILNEPLPPPNPQRAPAPVPPVAARPRRSAPLSTPFEEAFDEPGVLGPEPAGTSEQGAATWESKPSEPLPVPAASEPAWASGPPAPLSGPKPGRSSKGKSGMGGKLFLLLLLVAGGGAVYFFRPEWVGLGPTTSPSQAVPLPEPAPAQPLPAAPENKPQEAVPAKEPKPSPALAPEPPAPAVPVQAAPVQAAPTAPEPKPVQEAAPAVDRKPSPPPEAAPSGGSTAGNGAPPASPSPVNAPSPVAAKPESPEAKPEEVKPEPEPSKATTPPVVAPQPSVVVAPKEKAPPKKEAAKPETPAKRFRTLLLQARRMRDRGKSREALVLYGQASEIDPNSSDIFAGQGWCRLDLSQYEAAIENFEAALQRAPKHPDALMGLAETYRYAGRNADAIKYYQRYLAAHPDGEDAAAARNAVGQLKE